MTETAADTDGLRKRNLQQKVESSGDARNAVLKLNALEEQKSKHEQDQKTFGRTPNGTVFLVPRTHDMVSQLLSPSEPKNVGDILVLLVMIGHAVLLWFLPTSLKRFILATIFLCWRACYNIGIGYLLHMQSHHRLLVRWAQKTKLFDNPTIAQSENPRLRAFVKQELETKIPKDYDFDTAPLEYNTWLVFRRIVDLILMCDFVSYILFAFACARTPENEPLLITLLRWSGGLALFAFNLWVKLDAHRVVKDYAWYWGDFFYLIDQELTFDGVFEMAPHPMYSIGYVGYYGISLMAASYKVLFISIVAHAAQFAFLLWVENPHIERTYNSPPPRQHVDDSPTPNTENRPHLPRRSTSEPWPNATSDAPPTTHGLLGINNIDLHRTTDSSVLIMQSLMLALTLLTSNTAPYRVIFALNAAIWRIWFSVGLGYLLNRQSNKKNWTRHFLKYGESTAEAWRQWKGTYHLSAVLCYTSFAAAAWKSYSLPPNWGYGMVLLKHVVGMSLIALQIWVSVSIYDSLGEFGWFYGDFFYDQHPRLTYSGIYRFLNNPERVLGLAGVWGVALITSSKAIFCLALLSHTLSLAFIQLVERPHMQKLYGRNLRQDAGLVRSLRRSLPPPFRQWQDGMDKMMDESLDWIEEFLDAAKPKLADGVNVMVQDTKNLFNKYPARISIRRLDPDMIGINAEDYSLRIEAVLTVHHSLHKVPDSNLSTDLGSQHTSADQPTPLQFEYGTPIKVTWTAPVAHSKKDWVGLYRVSANTSREATRISSAGRWIATNFGEYDMQGSEVGILTSDTKAAYDSNHVSGEVLFSGDKLMWTQGTFEFRYHHNGRYNVLAISQPFTIRISRFSEDDFDLSTTPYSPQNDILVRTSIENTILPMIQNCFDRDPDIAPSSVTESFGGLVDRDGKYAKRVVYAIQQMFGIEFAPQVVKADGKVGNLAWRIWEAKKVLAPYNMSQSKGTATPVDEK